MQAIKPVVCNFGVAIQEEYIVCGVQCHPAVDGCDKAKVAFVLEQGYAWLLLGKFTQPLCQGRFWAGIVDYYDVVRLCIGGLQY